MHQIKWACWRYRDREQGHRIFLVRSVLRLHSPIITMKTLISKYYPIFAHKPAQSKLNPGEGGLTLIELLIAASLVPLVIILASQIFISQVKSERSLLGAQSSENLRSRLSFLLESDIADGEVILSSSNISCPTATGRLFSIRSPYLDISGALQHACISYSIASGSLFRSGPPILTNGSLDFASSVTQQVAAGVQITNLAISTSGTKIDFDLTTPSFLGVAAKTYSVSYGTKNFRVGT